jgi:hypothetical protein
LSLQRCQWSDDHVDPHNELCCEGQPGWEQHLQGCSEREPEFLSAESPLEDGGMLGTDLNGSIVASTGFDSVVWRDGDKVRERTER